MKNLSILNLPVTIKNNVQVMSSLDLAKLCVGESKDAHSNFMKKAEKVLGEDLVNFYDISKRHLRTKQNNAFTPRARSLFDGHVVQL